MTRFMNFPFAVMRRAATCSGAQRPCTECTRGVMGMMSMKRMIAMCLLPALMAPIAVQAGLTELRVGFSPDLPDYNPDAWDLDVSVSSDGTDVEYQFALEPMARTTVIPVTLPWSAAATATLDIPDPPGEYRVRVSARERANPAKVLVKYRTLRVRSSLESKVLGTRAMLQVVERYTRAQRELTEAMLVAKQKRASGEDTTSLCSQLASGASAIDALIARPGESAASGGGPAFVAAVDSGNDSTGAVSVVAVRGCSSSLDWQGVGFEVYLPAYPPTGTGLANAVRSINFDSILLPADVQARYTNTVNHLRKELYAIRDSLAGTGEAGENGEKFMSTDLLVNYIGERDALAGRTGWLFLPEGYLRELSSLDGIGLVGVDVIGGPGDGGAWQDISVVLRVGAYPSDGSGLPAKTTVIRFPE